jgi:4-cresol dehydrogenase (hydroxylating)
MTIWLAPRPSNLQTFFYKMCTDEHLEEVVDVLTELRLNGFIRTPMLLGNEYRFLSFGAGYPWSASGGKTPLPASLLNDMKNRANLGAWMGEGALHSLSPAHAEADRDYLLNRLDKLVDGIEFWDEARIAGGDKSQLLPDTKMAWESNPHRGHSIPSSAAVAYWRKKTSRPPDSDLNPDRDNCGVIWFAPALPARGSDARTVTQLYENITARYGYEPNMGLLFATARCIYMTGALVYDRDQPGEDDKAMECYKELFSKLVEAGYPPYRLGIQSMSALENGSVYDDFIHQLKSVLDPNHVIAPGRYTGAEKFH